MEVGPIKSFSRMAAVLRAVVETETRGGWARLADVAGRTELHRATAHRFLKAMEGEGWIERDADRRQYRVGPQLLALAGLAGSRNRLLTAGRAAVAALAGRLGDTVYLFQRAGIDAVCLDRQSGAWRIQTWSVDIGDRRPLGVGAGALALLAALDDDEADEVIAQVHARGGEGADRPFAWYRARIDTTRRHGYSDSEGLVPGARGIGMALRGPDGVPIGALSVATLDERLRDGHREAVIAGLQRQVERLAARLAGRR